MTVPEIVRELVDGEWRTTVGSSGGGGGGDASDVTVDPAVGGQTNVQDALEALAAGGSQPIEHLVYEFEFDTPDLAPVNEIQQVAITGTPDGGTFTVTLDGVESDPIDFDADATAVTLALAGPLAPFPLNVTVTGDNPTFAVEYTDGLLVPTLELGDNSLTGGTSPTVAVTRTQDASPGLVVATLAEEEGLYDSWFEIPERWIVDTGTASGNLGFFLAKAQRGFFDYGPGAADLTLADDLEYAIGMNANSNSNNLSLLAAMGTTGYRLVPATVATEALENGGELRLCVTATGRPNGDPLDNPTAGRALLHLLLLRAV